MNVKRSLPVALGFVCTAGVLAALVAGLSAPSGSVAALPPAPNIIVILADDLGYADISAYKVGRFHTPNIDRIGLEACASPTVTPRRPCADRPARAS